MIFFSHSSRIRILQLTLASLLGVGGGGGSNTPIGASCYRNRVKLRPLGLHLFFLTSSCLANRKSFLANKGKLKTNPSWRKHPFLLALRHWGRFAKSEEKRMFSQAKLTPEE